MTIRAEESLLAQFRATCQQHGLRVTPQRIIIYKELINSDDHPSAEQVYTRLKDSFPEISFDTVYRSLSTFNQIGILERVDGYGTAMRFDPDLSRHHHFRCRLCDTLIDIDDQHLSNLKAPDDISKSCEITNVCVTFEGYCKHCKKTMKGDR